MTRTRLLTPFVLLLFVGLLGAGCDSGGSSGGDGIIAPNNAQVSFNVKPDSSQTKSFTLSYRGLSERPQFDAESIPAVYQMEATGETGSPSDGTSSYEVTFNGPGSPGSYPAPVQFRAGEITTKIRLAGLVLGIFPVADFEEGIEGFFPFGVGIQVENEQLRIDGSNVGGSGQYPGFGTGLGGPTDFSSTPVVAARIKVTASSDGPAILRGALNTAEGSPNADRSVDDLVKDVPANGEYATYYFDFRGNFVNYQGLEVDPTKIRQLVFLVNDNNPDTFSGTIYIDEITRRQNIPDEE